MKFKIIASVIVLLIIIVALFLKGCPSQPATDENGNPVDTTTDTTAQQ